MDNKISHGTATLKKDLIMYTRTRKIGETGTITSFLPEWDRYSVMFGENIGPDNWVVMGRTEFDKYFDYELRL